MRTRFLLVSITLALSLCACTSTDEKTIVLELRYTSDAMPEACFEQRAIAEQNFRQKWTAFLFAPASTRVVQSDAERTKTGAATLAPVGSFRVIRNESTLTNQIASVFIHCAKREAYVQARSSYDTQGHWYGPFKY